VGSIRVYELQLGRRNGTRHTELRAMCFWDIVPVLQTGRENWVTMWPWYMLMASQWLHWTIPSCCYTVRITTGKKITSQILLGRIPRHINWDGYQMSAKTVASSQHFQCHLGERGFIICTRTALNWTPPPLFLTHRISWAAFRLSCTVSGFSAI
jgi:hypothetical protein